MELRHLEAFVAVAEEASFTRAAARLYVAQSGLSATIRSLERELRAPLFSRTTRHVELTAAGEALLGEARRTLASARAAVEAVDAVEGVRRGTLSLGIMQASSLFNVAGLLARFNRAYPGIELKLQHAGTAELGRLLEEHRLDIIFRTELGESSPEFTSMLLVTSPLVVGCAREHDLAGKRTIDLRVLAGTALIGFPEGWGIRTLADTALRARGVEPHYAFEVNDTSALLDLVEVGLGVAVLPEALADPRSPGVHQIGIKGRSWDWAITAQTLAPRPGNPAAQALWTMLAQSSSSSDSSSSLRNTS